jgi:hypothetical protein
VDLQQKTDRYEGVAAHKKKTKIDQIIPATATSCHQLLQAQI